MFIALLPSGAPALGVIAFGLAGLGCSALLPLTISFGQERLLSMSSSVASGVIALLPGWLRDRRVWHRPAPLRRANAAGDLRRERRGSGGSRPAFDRGREGPALPRRAASAASESPDVTDAY